MIVQIILPRILLSRSIFLGGNNRFFVFLCAKKTKHAKDIKLFFGTPFYGYLFAYKKTKAIFGPQKPFPPAINYHIVILDCRSADSQLALATAFAARCLDNFTLELSQMSTPSRCHTTRNRRLPNGDRPQLPTWPQHIVRAFSYLPMLISNILHGQYQNAHDAQHSERGNTFRTWFYQTYWKG